MDDELDEEQKRKRRAGDESEKMLDELAAHRAKTSPQWREVDGAWEMSVNGEVVAAIEPNSDTIFPDCVWLSRIVTTEYPDHGWDAVDFTTLEDAQRDIEQWWHHARHGEAYRPEVGPALASVANENNPERVAALDTREGDRDGPEPELGSAAHDAAVVSALNGIFAIGEPEPAAPQVTREAIEADPWNAVAYDLPHTAETDPELFLLIAETARDVRDALQERAEQAVTPGQQELWLAHAERAEARCTIAETLWAAQAHELTLDDIAERAQQLIDDPTRLAEESDQRVLDALDARRAAEVVPERPAEEEQRLYEPSEDAERDRSEASAAPALDAAMPHEMTDAAQIQYDRWTGELVTEAGPSREAGQTLGGGGMGRSR